ncbi:MAG: SusC/RagA family TonB-linked outer membrane protein [Tannerellaceae bacterium]|jgi:TonB-linked SusC/RagA family outer membrane protein|nr:SusC/RagA family TonB-linked outer membrane protein [Tannerellaceae bacterium]
MRNLFFKIVLITGLFYVSAAYAESYMEVARLSLDLKNSTIEDAFKAIEKQTEFSFFYDENELDSGKRIDLKVTNEKITSVLDKILDKELISYKITDRHIVLYKSRTVNRQTAAGIQQQQITVKGTVKDAYGEALPGVSIAIKGSAYGVITDIDGNYSIDVPGRDAVLVFSFVGFATQELPVGNRTVIDVTLAEDVQLISEVVVVGYGTLERKQLTNSVTSVSARELSAGLGGATIANSLSGKVSGLVMQETPSPNSDLTLQLRGMASINAASGPLVVIDGMPGGDIRSVVQEDIQSIDILKDASAGAIYGSRATGGVILITTKQAKEGKMKLTYTGEVIFKNTFAKPRVMNTQEYLQYKGSGNNYGGDYDWYEASLSDNPTSQRHVINLNGGSRDARIFSTVMFEDNRGTMLGDNRKDLSGRINGAFKLLDGWLDVNTHVTYRQANRNKATAGTPWFNNPTQSPYDGYPSVSWPETVSMVAARNSLDDARNKTDKVLEKWLRPDVEVKLNILPVQGLSYSQTFGYENRQSEHNLYEPSTLQRGERVNRSGLGTAQIEFDKTDQVNSEGYFSYIREIGRDHSINATAGFSYFEKNREKHLMKNYGFDFDAVGVWNMGSGSYLNNPNISDPKPEMYSQKAITERLFALFGRVNYSFRDKYIATATLRREGSSKFAENKRWGTFYGLSAAWRLSEESFLKDVEPVNDLKLRFSYGVTGNEGTMYTDDDHKFPISYGAVSYKPSSNKTMLPDGTWVSSYGTSRDINPNLGWEEKREWNIGLDYELLDRRIFGKFDFYRRDVNGLIFETHNSKGQHGVWYENIGALENSGWEFEIGGVIVNNKDWRYTTKMNISHNNTKVGVMDGTSNKVYGGYVGRAGDIHLLEEGAPVGAFLLYKYAGLENGNFTAYLPDGTLKVLDGDIDNSEKQYIGNYVPKAVIGWSHDLEYKNWYLQAQINSAVGFDVYNAFEHTNGLVAGSAGSSQNMLLVAYTKNAHITGPAQTTDYFLEDGTYVKIQNISLGYNLNLKKYSPLFDAAKIYLSVNNALRLTKYSGSSPEIDFTGWEGGIDRGDSYPQTRTFALGVQLTF